MGCDIHLVLEKRNGKKWVGIDTFEGHHDTYHDPKKSWNWCFPVARGRNYERFAALAGVRGDGPNPRGVPKNASDTTKLLIEQWGIDGHSHSWLPLAEAAKIWQKTDFNPLSEYATKYPESYYFGVEDENNELKNYRVVFWFDN